MKLTLRPDRDPRHEVDVRHCMIGAIAAELWRLYGGDDLCNWLEAERQLDRMLESLRREARAEGLGKARREADRTRERFFAMVTRMDRERPAAESPGAIPAARSVEPKNDGNGPLLTPGWVTGGGGKAGNGTGAPKPAHGNGAAARGGRFVLAERPNSPETLVVPRRARPWFGPPQERYGGHNEQG